MIKTKILYPLFKEDFVSAEVFENNFVHYIGKISEINTPSLRPWLKQFTSNNTVSKNLFLEAVDGYNILCFSKNMISFLPILMSLRNDSGSDIRFMIIAHSPALYIYEWYILDQIIKPNDIIIAPTNCAGEVIKQYSKNVYKNVRVIHHPVHTSVKLNKYPVLDNYQIAYLGRISENKFIHKIIEAIKELVLLNHNVILKIVGLNSADSQPDEDVIYLNYLNYLIKYWTLESNVIFTGQLKGENKERVLNESDVIINLSKTTEESYGKVVIEAIMHGKPVISTKWNGLTETVGEAGVLIELNDSFKVNSCDIVKAVLKLKQEGLDINTIIQQQKKFSIQNSQKLYQNAINNTSRKQAVKK